MKGHTSRQFELSRLALKDIHPAVLPAAERAQIEASLNRAAEAIRETIAKGQAALTRVEDFAEVIPFTPEIHAASHLRRVARLDRSPQFAIIFLERDAAHFDLPEIKTELAAAGVEVYFTAGETVHRMRELL